MSAISNDYHPHTELLRLIYGELHCFFTDHHAHSSMTIHYCGCGTFTNDLEVGDWRLETRLDPLIVDRLEPTYTVAVYSLLISRDEYVGADLCV